MKIYSRFTVTLLLALVLGGCQGIPLREIRNTSPIYTNDSTKPLNDVFVCFINELNQFRGDGRMLVLTYPEESKAEFSVGAMQAGNFKHYYIVSLARSPKGTRTEIQRAPSDYLPLSQKEVVDIAIKCMRPR